MGLAKGLGRAGRLPPAGQAGARSDKTGEVITDFGAELASPAAPPDSPSPGRRPTASACEPRESNRDSRPQIDPALVGKWQKKWD